MLKARIIPTLLYKDFGLVKGTGFDSWRPVGSAVQAVRVYNMREVDELILLDITATRDDREPDFAMFDEMADACFMPMTMGGGVRCIEDARRLLQVGADKIAVGAAAFETPDLVTSIADRFGSQCVVVSVDYRCRPDGRREVYVRGGATPTGLDPVAFAVEAARRGAGEILLQSIERDGTMTGYDIETIRRVCAAVSIPVIASGGAGGYDDMAEALLDAKASAAAAAAMFHFTQQTPLEAKRSLAKRGIPVRI